MTTDEAAARYLRAHQDQWGGQPLAVHNPHGKPLEDLPAIYGFNNGGSVGWLSAVLVAQDGTMLGGHGCSAEGYMPHDLGCLEGSRPDRHETFRAHYPDGYRMAFVPYDDAFSHEGLAEAIRRHQAKADADQAANVAQASEGEA